jgi:hypothetical protein
VNYCTVVGHSDLIADAKQTLHAKFMMKHLGEAKSLLSTEILCDQASKTISLQQQGHIEGILWDFRMENCVKAVTPIVPRQQLPTTQFVRSATSGSCSSHLDSTLLG